MKALSSAASHLHLRLHHSPPAYCARAWHRGGRHSLTHSVSQSLTHGNFGDLHKSFFFFWAMLSCVVIFAAGGGRLWSVAPPLVQIVFAVEFEACDYNKKNHRRWKTWKKNQTNICTPTLTHTECTLTINYCQWEYFGGDQKGSRALFYGAKNRQITGMLNVLTLEIFRKACECICLFAIRWKPSAWHKLRQQKVKAVFR